MVFYITIRPTGAKLVTTMPNHDGIRLRTAATIAGIAYLLNPVSYAEFTIYPKLVMPGQIAQTVANISAHPQQFLIAVFCYLCSFVGDIVLAWVLYVLLAPVNRAVSLLASWFQLIYAAIALVGALNLMSVYQLVTQPEYAAAFGNLLNAEIALSLHAFRYEWNLSLALFGVHLVLIGGLIWRSSYIPKVLGILLAINGLGWVVNSLGPYIVPNADFDWLFTTFFGEVLFMLWLLIRGWKIPDEPATA
jgi:hypothetical protein